MLGDGVGNYVQHSTLTNYAGSGHQELADLDGDGDLDVASLHWSQFGSYNAYICYNDGTATFNCVGKSKSAGGGNNCYVMGGAVADLNNDGKGDLAVLCRDEGIRVWLSNGSGGHDIAGGATGTSAYPLTAITYAGQWKYGMNFGDIDNDGDIDCLLYGSIRMLLLNDGNGGWSVNTTTRATRANTPSSHDNYELHAAVGPLSECHPVLTKTDGTCYYATVYDAAMGDLNGDGNLDIVMATHLPDYSSRRSAPTFPGAPNFVYWGDGKGNMVLDSVSGLCGAEKTFAVEFGDIDGDGDLDVVFGNSDTQSKVHMNDGFGGFTLSTDGMGGPSSVSVGVMTIVYGDLTLVRDISSSFARFRPP